MCRMRAILVLCVAFAYAGAPLALDVCARACASAGPSCHTAAPASAHVRHLPALCGSEHDVVRSSSSGTPSSRITGGIGVAVAILPAGRHADAAGGLVRDPLHPRAQPLL